MSSFSPVPSNVSFPDLETRILEFWRENDTFATSVSAREGAPKFVFYDGPPFATGTPHHGHLLAGTLKDIVPRYWTMRGYQVERRFGWDCHGLPIEALAQEELGLAGSAAINEHGVAAFNEQCRSMVQTYVSEWRHTVERMGRWVDFDNDYKTMDVDFMETVWWVVKQLWDKDRIYRAHRVMPYSWKLTTPLSNFEAGSNYQDIQDPAITVRFRLCGDDNRFFLAWTTTPWTLPSNLGLAVGADVEYVEVEHVKSGDQYVLAASRLDAVFPKMSHNGDELREVARHQGDTLVGLTYEPLFPYFADQANAFQVFAGDFVTTEDGTGIVHMAPAFGEDDYRVCVEAGIELVDPLDPECAFTSLVPEYEGTFCKDADKAIIRRLKDEGKLVRQDTIMHAYPFDDRTDTPLIYRAISAWYVKVEDMRDRLVEENAKVNWVPEYVGTRRFHNWLEGALDWNISRNRFWGSCLPVWISEDGEDMICVGSRKELHELSGVMVDDLHKHVVDEVTFEKNGKTYRRTPEVLDCWFESGSMPYAQHHYPFSGIELDSCFPAKFIAEGLDQTRGWFYTMLVLSTTLFEQSSYQNVIVNGMILAEDGAKMSKRKKNYPDPDEVLNKYGADALRAYLINSPAVRGEPLRFSEAGITEILRKVMLPLWNAYSFFVTYANVDGWTPGREPVAAEHRLDRWILSSLDTLVCDVNELMDKYLLYKVIDRLDEFIDDLTNWYIRRSRERFWGSDDEADKAAGYQTLYDVLVTFSKVLAPVLPFMCEEMYRNLTRALDGAPESVHLADFPQTKEGRRDERLEREMHLARAIVRLGRTLRAKHKVKTRQPLTDVTVVAKSEADRALIREMEAIILEELNVKALTFTDQESDLVTLGAKANFRVLGRRFGPRMREAAAVICQFGAAEVGKLEAGESVDVLGEPLTLDDIVICRTEHEGHVTETDGGVTVSLSLDLTPELIAEGYARELKNRIQSMRKDADFHVADRIAVVIGAAAEFVDAVKPHADYLKTETLADELTFTELNGDGAGREWDLDGETVSIEVTRRSDG